MIVQNHKGIFNYPYILLKNKKIYYKTKIWGANGLRERTRRLRQMLKIKK